MKRNFITLEKAQEIYLNSPDKINSGLTVKTDNGGNISLEPVMEAFGFKTTILDDYVDFCSKENQQLLVEVLDKEIKKRKIEKRDLLKFKVNNDIYYNDITKEKEKETVKLIEYGALSNGMIKDYPLDDFKVVTVLPSITNKGKLFFDKNDEIITMKQNIKETRDFLHNNTLGADMYIYTENPELLDDCRTWVTEFKEEEDNVYSVNSRNYFVVEELSLDELKNLSKEDLKDYKTIINKATPMKRSEITGELTDTFNTENTSFENVFMIKRENIEHLLTSGIDNIKFADILSVYKQQDDSFTKTSIEEVLDKPRTYVKKEKAPYENKDAHKIHIFYEHDTSMPLPTLLKGGTPVEFEPIDITGDGNTIWKKSTKIVKNEHNLEYINRLEASGNKFFIEITDMENEMDIYNQLKDSGLFHEFVLINTPESKKRLSISYYVSKPVINTKPKDLTTERDIKSEIMSYKVEQTNVMLRDPKKQALMLDDSKVKALMSNDKKVSDLMCIDPKVTALMIREQQVTDLMLIDPKVTDLMIYKAKESGLMIIDEQKTDLMIKDDKPPSIMKR